MLLSKKKKNTYCKRLFQMLYRYVASSCSQCFIFLFATYVTSVYLDVAYVSTQMMQIFYLDAAYVYNGYMCFCKCFRRMFHLFLVVYYNCCIWMFQN
jgi:hypothetical protein